MTEVHRRIRSIIVAEGDRRRSLEIPNWMTLEEYKTCDDYKEYWQPEEECHDMDWSDGNAWNTDNAPEQLFMGNDSCLEDNTSEEYYTYNTDSTNCFSYLTDYTYDYDS